MEDDFRCIVTGGRGRGLFRHGFHVSSRTSFFFWIYTAKEKKKMFRTEFFFRPLPELTPDIGVCKVATQER